MDDMKNEMVNSLDGFVGEIKQIIDSARANAVRSVDLCRVQMYWNIGKRIFEKEQQGKERADYGSYLIKNLSKRITPDYGSGFSVRQLEMCRQFYRTYPIANTVCSQLNWSQYKLLIAIPDTDKRKYYQLEAVNNGWTKRELERQINSLLYERLLLSNDKEAVLAVAQNQRIPESPTEIIKDPMVLEFLGLERRASYYERDLESAIISHIADFLLEMGKGFSFVARQKRLLVEDDEYFADLVFYNRLLRSFVVIELKTGEFKPEYAGQLNFYLSAVDGILKKEQDNPSIGLLLCKSKNDLVAEYSLKDMSKPIGVSAYQITCNLPEELERQLPSVEDIQKRIKGAKNNS